MTDAAGAEKMSLTAALGHACGRNFKAAEHVSRYPEFAWDAAHRAVIRWAVKVA